MNQDTKSALELNGSFPLRLTRFPWHKATRNIPSLSCIEYTSQSQATPSIISSGFPHYQLFSSSVSSTATKYRPWARWASERSASGLPLFTSAGTPANLSTTRLKCPRGRRNARPARSFFPDILLVLIFSSGWRVNNTMTLDQSPEPQLWGHNVSQSESHEV